MSWPVPPLVVVGSESRLGLSFSLDGPFSIDRAKAKTGHKQGKTARFVSMEARMTGVVHRDRGAKILAPLSREEKIGSNTRNSPTVAEGESEEEDKILAGAAGGVIMERKKEGYPWKPGRITDVDYVKTAKDIDISSQAELSLKPSWP